MSRTILVVALLVAAIARADVSTPGTATPATPKRVFVPWPNPLIVAAHSGQTQARVHIVAKDECGPGLSVFTPSQADVERIERLLPQTLADYAARGERGASQVLRRLSTDMRNYFGERNGTISVDGFCAGSIAHENDGGKCLRADDVDDGGSCFWRISFDPKTGRFSGFGINGIG